MAVVDSEMTQWRDRGQEVILQIMKKQKSLGTSSLI